MKTIRKKTIFTQVAIDAVHDIVVLAWIWDGLLLPVQTTICTEITYLMFTDRVKIHGMSNERNYISDFSSVGERKKRGGRPNSKDREGL